MPKSRRNPDSVKVEQKKKRKIKIVERGRGDAAGRKTLLEQEFLTHRSGRLKYHL